MSNSQLIDSKRVTLKHFEQRIAHERGEIAIATPRSRPQTERSCSLLNPNEMKTIYGRK